MIAARIERDSIALNGARLTTFVLTYPRFIHSELMTHRVFSRNAASSRAIPFDRMVRMVANETARPIHWGGAKPGMQSGEQITEVWRAQQIWDRAMVHAVEQAEALNELGVH